MAIWNPQWRETTLNQIALDQEKWDLLIIGGGITGAGIFHEASRSGLKVLLVEQRDFAWGTSSRSSKLIHGGIRYLMQGDLSLTWHSAREREYLIRKYPGLVEPLPFLLPIYRGQFPGKWVTLAGLTFYDFLAGHWNHAFWDRDRVLREVPKLAPEGLLGAAHFFEATTDDARLVLQLLKEGSRDRAVALNYVSVAKLDSDKHGATLRDACSGREMHVQCRLIVNATGVFADQLRQNIRTPRLRPLRGSHLIFPLERLPLKESVTILHPEDRRPVFAYPWQGAVLVGTTDLDYQENLNQEPTITSGEVDYLLKALHTMFPSLHLSRNDILSTFSGLRPIVSSGKQKRPSQERRDSAVWLEKDLLTVTGGKLTTFRITAREALTAARQQLPDLVLLPPEKEVMPIPYQPVDLRTAARSEAVIHLDDLLLRRTKLGLTEPKGAIGRLPEIESVCRQELGWDEAKWKQEVAAYLQTWQKHYSIPENKT